MGRPRALKKLSAAQIAEAMASAPSMSAAALVLGVDKGTISRWVASGKVPAPSGVVCHDEATAHAEQADSPQAWGEWVRQKYVLTRSELELVGLAETSLSMARDVEIGVTSRLQAMARFSALLTQLKLEPESKSQPVSGQGPMKVSQPLRRTGTDPRMVLMAVK